MTRVMTAWSQNYVQLIMFEMHITNIGPDALMAYIPPNSLECLPGDLSVWGV